MTHVVGVYIGYTGGREREEHLNSFLKWIRGLQYDVVDDAGRKITVSPTPRLILPMDFRIHHKARDEFLKDLKNRLNKKQQSKIDKIPFKRIIGLSDVKLDGIQHNSKEELKEKSNIPIEDFEKAMLSWMVILGEIEDEFFESGSEAL